MSKQEFKKVLNQNRFLLAKPDESIFNAASRAGLTLNHSCLNGRCNSIRFENVDLDIRRHSE